VNCALNFKSRHQKNKFVQKIRPQPEKKSHLLGFSGKSFSEKEISLALLH